MRVFFCVGSPSITVGTDAAKTTKLSRYIRLVCCKEYRVSERGFINDLQNTSTRQVSNLHRPLVWPIPNRVDLHVAATHYEEETNTFKIHPSLNLVKTGVCFGFISSCDACVASSVIIYWRAPRDHPDKHAR